MAQDEDLEFLHAAVGRPHEASSLAIVRVDCLNEGFCHLTTYLRFPREHWKRIRHSNFIERTFGETRRRVKVQGVAADRGPLPRPVSHREERPSATAVPCMTRPGRTRPRGARAAEVLFLGDDDQAIWLDVPDCPPEDWEP